jgi:diguanylate cyclase (GGDEF)-like protein
MMPDKDTVSAMIEEWRRPRGFHAFAVLLVLSLTAVLITGIVFITGGAVSIYPHLMYGPIVLASVLFRTPGGIFAGMVAGLLLGPYMPLSTEQAIPQEPFNWIMRMCFFMLMGGVGGFISRCYNDHLDNTQDKSFHDRPTGLPNLQALSRRLDELLSEEKAGQHKEVTLAILTISNLKQVVATLGFRSSSAIINQIAERLSKEGELPEDSLFRIQENSFAVIAVDVNVDNFIKKCRIITKHLEDPFFFENIPIAVDMHFGISCSCSTGDSRDEMIQKAGIAVYNAEKNKTLYAEYSSRDDSNSVERLALLGSVKKAIDTSQLTLFLQPKVSIADKKLVGVESLIRWQHPDLGLLTPAMFIPEAEKTWLIHPLSLFAVKEGLAQIKCMASGGYDMKLAINLTAHAIQDRILIARLIKSVREMGIEAALLEIEITERFLVTEFGVAREILGALKKMGASIAIDDFGTGYSSVHYLQELPIDTVKLDQSLVANIASSDLSRSLIRHMIEFNRELGITTVAEGVETEEQFNILAEMGCDVAQGYYIGKPLPCEEFRQWLETSPWKVSKREV